MKSDKVKLKIGQIASQLNINQSVIRFWEKEFKFKAKRSLGGQRYYTNQDLNKFIQIKELLYHQGSTIEEAKVQLKQLQQKNINTTLVAASKTTLGTSENNKNQNHIAEDLTEQITVLHKKLIKLRELL